MSGLSNRTYRAYDRFFNRLEPKQPEDVALPQWEELSNFAGYSGSRLRLMPLLKLWNSIRGKTNAESAPEPAVQPAKPSPSGQPAKSPEAVPAVAASSQPTKSAKAAKPARKAKPDQETTKPTSKKKPAKKRGGLLGRRAPQSPLLKKLGSHSAKSVLEVGVGDGSRAIEVVTCLQESTAEQVRYAAIDQFEMGGGETTLMQFHQTLRSASIRPQVFPEPFQSGMLRVAHTLGAVDLVLICDTDLGCNSAEFQALLDRVTHSESRVLLHTKDTWTEVPVKKASDIRRAA